MFSKGKNKNIRGVKTSAPRAQANNRRPSRENVQKSPLPSMIYGVLPVLERLRADAKRIDRIFVLETANEGRLNEIINLAGKERIQIRRMPRSWFDRTASGANHQGVIASAAAAAYRDSAELLEELSENPLLVLVDGVEDPRNLGAILRSAECAGVEAVFIPERRAAGLNDTVAKSSAGAVEHIAVARVGNLNRLITELKERGIFVIGTSGAAVTDYSDCDFTKPTALVMGSEGEGLHRLVAENCDQLVKIPMRGKVESLNVSVATGVILFEAQRQRDILKARGEK